MLFFRDPARGTSGLVARLGFALAMAALTASGERISDNAAGQIAALLEEKAARNDGERKMDSHLVHAAKMLRGEAVHPNFPRPPGTMEAVTLSAAGEVEVDIRADVTPALLAFIARVQGTVINAFPQYGAVRARLPLVNVEQVARRTEVRFIRVADPGHSNATLPDGPGDIAHQANVVRTNLGFDGTGVKVGVLSDAVQSLAAEQAAGRLPANVTVVGTSFTGDEGTAMLEVVHSLAPGASLYFASSEGGEAGMAANVQALVDAGCQVIIDDWTYFGEGLFQDGPIAMAVNAAAAKGVLYFSDAQNSGSLSHGSSGTWEGDFSDSGTSIAAIPGATIHNFALDGSVVNNDQLRRPTQSDSGFAGYYELKWSDPLGGSGNDYDLFILDAGMATVLGSSTNVQGGVADPEEYIKGSGSIPAGSRIVIVKHAGAEVRALHLDTERGALAIGTNSATFGHNAAAGAFTMAAAHVPFGRGAFVAGQTNPTENYSSDGPRRMFFNDDGSPITPGNILIGSNGGQVLAKPDFTGADGVPTGAPGYGTFTGTSAAAPHAGAIAALMLQAKPGLTPAQARAALTASALDIEGAGFDVNAGAGIVMAPTSVAFALGTLPGPAINAGGIVSAVGTGAVVAPGSIVSVYGNFTGATAGVAGVTPLPLRLGSLSMESAGTGAPLFYASATQVNMQVPWEFAGALQASFVASVNGVAGPATAVAMSDWAPGIFTLNQQGTGQGAIVDALGRVVDATNAATAGVSIVSIYCTGLGPVSNPPATGTVALSNPLSKTTKSVSVTIGGAVARVEFAGLAPGAVGEYQVNVLVPSGAAKGNAVPVQVSVNGVSSNTVTMAVR